MPGIFNSVIVQVAILMALTSGYIARKPQKTDDPKKLGRAWCFYSAQAKLAINVAIVVFSLTVVALLFERWLDMIHGLIAAIWLIAIWFNGLSKMLHIGERVAKFSDYAAKEQALEAYRQSAQKVSWLAHPDDPEAAADFEMHRGKNNKRPK